MIKDFANECREVFTEYLQEERDDMKKFMAYLKDESGQTSTEYILLVAVVAMIVFKFKKTGGDALDNLTTKVFGQADKMVDDMGK